MAERKATNKYYPPDYDPRKGSLNAFVGSHPLRERARKLDRGILIVRFEMPFNVWCEGCNNHIGRGVRYNAEKKQAGSYFSTKIWNFRMKCHLCDNYIEVNTDPKNSDYVIVAGASRKVETWEADEEETGTIRLADEEEAKRLAEDPFYRLEHASEDQRKAKATAPILERLQDLRSGYEDDYDNNQRLRSSFRKRKKEIVSLEKEAESKGLAITLLPQSQEDKQQASRIVFRGGRGSEEELRRRRLQVSTSSIFSHNKNNKKQPLIDQQVAKRRRLAHLQTSALSSSSSSKKASSSTLLRPIITSSKPK